MAVAVLLSLFTFINSAWAATLNNSVGASFPNDEVRVHVATHSCGNIGRSTENILNLAAVGVDRFWNTVPTSRLRLEKGELVSVANDFATGAACTTGSGSSCTAVNSSLVHSNDIIISCNTETSNFSNSTGILAVALPNNISGQDINGAIVLLNNMPSTGLASLSDDEFISVLAHEIGHAVGLGHSKFEKNLMHFASSSSRFYLGQDDIHGITILYPANQPFTGCGTIYQVGDSPKKPIALLLTLISFAIVSLGARVYLFSERASSLKT